MSIPLEYSRLEDASSVKQKCMNVAIYSGIIAGLVLSLLFYFVYGELQVSSPTRSKDHLSADIVVRFLFWSIAALSLFLGYAGFELWRRPRVGVVLLDIYVALQFLASIAFGAACMGSIYNSPAGMLFFLGAIPGLVGCLPAIMILIPNRGIARLLSRSANSN